MNYPSPCDTCQKGCCSGIDCAEWQIRYRHRQKLINRKALHLARGETAEKTSVWVYMHPDEFRRYLKHSPCETCFVKDLCDTPCQRHLTWYDANMEQARKKVNQ